MALANPHDVAPSDRTLRRALADSRQRFKDLVEISSDFAWEIDALALFTFVSPRGALGWKASDLVGRDVATFLDDPARRAVFAARAPVSGQEIWFRRANGESALLSVAAKPVVAADGNWAGTRGVCRDVTELRRHERDLAEARLHDGLMTCIVRTMRDELDPATGLKAALSATGLAIGASGGAVLRDSEQPALHWGEAAPNSALDAARGRLGDAASGVFSGDEHHLIFHTARFQQQRQGAILLWKPEERGAFGEDDRALLADVADYLGVALAQIAALEQIISLSRTDGLTWLLNRRAFLGELDRRLTRLGQEDGGTPQGALMFIDLDNFKRVNDQLGHAAGDRVLVAVADGLRRLGRSGDLIARLGGDEFVLWIDHIGRATALKRAHALLEGLLAQAKTDGGEEMRMIGMSVGVAFAASGSEEASGLIARADAAMYRAKQSGKGTVVAAPDFGVAA